MIKITFPDNSVREYNEGVTAFEIATGISPRLAKEVLSASVNDEVWDLTRPIHSDASLKLHKWDEPEAKHAFWHSSAHLMAQALELLYPGIKFGIGPDIENGFYYDVDPGEGVVISENDLPLIEKKMKELASENNRLTREEISKKDALKFFSDKGDEYKLELINELEDGTITLYKLGDFTDLCRGPHLTDTAKIKGNKAIKSGRCILEGRRKTKDDDPYLWYYLPEAGHA